MKTPKFWNYNTDAETGLIYHNNNNNKFLSIDTILKLPKKKQVENIRNNLDLVHATDSIDIKVDIINYIYYILYYTRLHLNNKHFYKIAIYRILCLIKIDYFEKRSCSYNTMSDFKYIYYLFTGIYICEYENCSKDCSNKKKTFCNVHIRKRNKLSKQISKITNLPFDICNIIVEYK